MINKLSIKTALFLLITSTCVLVSFLIILISFYTSSQTANKMIKDIVQLTSTHILDKTTSYLSIADKISMLTGNLAKSGVVTTDNESQISDYFRNILLINERFSMVYYGDFSGNFLMAKRMPDSSLSIKTIKRNASQAITSWKHENQELAKDFPPSLSEATDKAYDPRSRPWFTKVRDKMALQWTDVYVFFTDHNIGVTCAAPIFDDDGKMRGIVGIDIALKQLSEFLSSLKVTDNSKSFILNDKMRLIAYPIENGDYSVLVKNNAEKSGFETVDVNDFFDKTIEESYKAYQKDSTPNRVLDFKHNGENYITSFYPFSVSKDWKWFVALVVPKNDFEGPLIEARNINFIIVLCALVLIVILSYLIANNISKPLGELELNMTKVKQFDLTHTDIRESHFKEIESISDAFEGMIKGLRSFEKYVPTDLVKELLLIGKEATLGGEKRDLTVFFSDIAGFTSISEKLKPDELVNFLSMYLSDLTNSISDEKGTIDKYIGDAIMAFWGAPKELLDHAKRACEAALICQQKVLALKERHPDIPEFFTRIGIHSGEVVVGNVGSSSRLNYTVLGDTVNTASRLESINKFYGTKILISDTTFALVNDSYFCRTVDFVKLKGKEQVITLYELIAKIETIDENIKKNYEIYESGISAYKEKKWDSAISSFQNFQKKNGKDSVSEIFIERCQEFRHNPPEASWQGEITHDHK